MGGGNCLLLLAHRHPHRLSVGNPGQLHRPISKRSQPVRRHHRLPANRDRLPGRHRHRHREHPLRGRPHRSHRGNRRPPKPRCHRHRRRRLHRRRRALHHQCRPRPPRPRRQQQYRVGCQGGVPPHAAGHRQHRIGRHQRPNAALQVAEAVCGAQSGRFQHPRQPDQLAELLNHPPRQLREQPRRHPPLQPHRHQRQRPANREDGEDQRGRPAANT